MMHLKFYLGLSSFILSAIAIVLNFLIFLPVFRMAFVSKKSSVYIIAFFNVISDVIQLLIVCFYLSICIMMDKYFLTESQTSTLNIVIGWIFINAWYMESLVQIVMAVNRFCIITLNMYHIFTYRFTIVIFILLVFFTSLLATLTQYIFPCCQFVAEHIVLAWMFLNPNSQYNFSYTMLVSFDILCTVSSSVCYASVFLTLRNSYKEMADIKGQHSSQEKKDMKYLVQFVFISVFYVFTWICFEIFPHVVPADKLEFFWIITLLVIMNSSSNSVIFLVCNKEIQKSIRTPWTTYVAAESRVSTVASKSIVA